MTTEIGILRNQSLLTLRTLHHTYREVELRQDTRWACVATTLPCRGIGATGDCKRPILMLLILRSRFIGINIKVKVSLEPYTILVIRSYCPVGFLARKRRKKTLIEELTSTIPHCIVCPRIAVGVFEDLRRSIGTFLPRLLVGEEGRRDWRVVNATSWLPYIILVILGIPSTTHIHHVIGLSLIIDITHGEEDLIFIRVIEDIIIHKSPILIEEIERESPTLETTTDDTNVVGPLLLVVLLEVGDGTLTLYFDRRPRASIVVDDDELLLLPRSIGIDEVSVHHTITVRVPFLEHNKTSSPILERSIRIRIS